MPLYMLAFDHRHSLTEMFGPHGSTYMNRTVDYRALKSTIWSAVGRAVEKGNLQKSSIGILIDEEYGSEVALQALRDKITVAMPAERSLQRVFDFEFGDRYREHIETFDPDHVKVLVVADETLSEAERELANSRLRELSDWLSQRRQKLMVELLVYPSEQQLARVGHSRKKFDEEVRSTLMVDAIKSYQDWGIEPDIWKVEGLDSREKYEAVATQARAEGRDSVECIILGRGADDDQIKAWLQAAGESEGFTGFAIGRSTWSRSLLRMMSGEINESQAQSEIADRFLSHIELFERVSGSAR